MIINKQGEKCLCSNGVEYIIGEEVIGTENGGLWSGTSISW